jgi:cell division protein FtsB
MRYLNVALIAMLVVLQFDLWVGDGSIASAWQLQQAIANQRDENGRLKSRNDTLAAEVEDLKSGLSAIEERARSELGMIKKGETFVQVVDGKK